MITITKTITVLLEVYLKEGDLEVHIADSPDTTLDVGYIGLARVGKVDDLQKVLVLSPTHLERCPGCSKCTDGLPH